MKNKRYGESCPFRGGIRHRAGDLSLMGDGAEGGIIWGAWPLGGGWQGEVGGLHLRALGSPSAAMGRVGCSVWVRLLPPCRDAPMHWSSGLSAGCSQLSPMQSVGSGLFLCLPQQGLGSTTTLPEQRFSHSPACAAVDLCL